MIRNVNLWEVIFSALLLLKVAGVQPFAVWSNWWIIAPLFVSLLARFASRCWRVYGCDEYVREAVQDARYEILRRKYTKKFKNELSRKDGNK